MIWRLTFWPPKPDDFLSLPITHGRVSSPVPRPGMPEKHDFTTPLIGRRAGCRYPVDIVDADEKLGKTSDAVPRTRVASDILVQTHIASIFYCDECAPFERGSTTRA